MNDKIKVRIARPTDKLADIQKMYIEGLGFTLLGSFADHKSFDGVMLGHADYLYHLEFTHHRGTMVGKAPTQDNLLIFYMPDKAEWDKTCTAMEAAGFLSVASYNPFWDEAGRTFEDLDGYRVVLQNSHWLNESG